MKDMNALQSTRYWTTGWSKRSLLAAISCVVLTLSACGGDSVSSPVSLTPTTPVGSYDIQTVNGKSVPVTIQSDGTYTNEITAGVMTLTAGGTWSKVTTTRVTVPGSVQIYADTNAGAWTQSADSIQFTSTLDGTKQGALWVKGLLTVVTTQDNSNVTLVYYQRR